MINLDGQGKKGVVPRSEKESDESRIQFMQLTMIHRTWELRKRKKRQVRMYDNNYDLAVCPHRGSST